MAVTITDSLTHSFKSILFTCVSAVGGTASGTSTIFVDGVVDRVVVVPGAGVTDGFKVKLSDVTTCDLLDGDNNDGVSIDNALIPKNFPISKGVASTLTCAISGAGSTKTVLVYVFYR